MGRTDGLTDWRTDGRTRRRLYAPPKFFGEHKKIQSSDWPKWPCALLRYIIARLLLKWTSFQMLRQTGCSYVNWRIYNLCAGCPEMMFDPTKECHLSQLEECHLSQLIDWMFCVSLVSRTCNVWRNRLSHICWSIEHHFKRPVNTLIASVVNVSDHGGMCRNSYCHRECSPAGQPGTDLQVAFCAETQHPGGQRSYS